MSGRKRKSRGGTDELTREQQVQRDWTFEAHKKMRGGEGGEEGDDNDDVKAMDIDPVPKRGPGRPRKSITPKKKPLPQEEKEEGGGEGEGEDVLVDLYEARPARSVPQASRSRSRRRESGLHLPMPSAAASYSPAPSAPSFRSPSPRPPDTHARSSSHRSVTQQIRFDAPTPKAAPKSAAKPSAVKLSAGTPAAAQTAVAYTPRSASLRKPASGAASLLLVLGLMALVLARLVVFPVRHAPPSAASLGAARRAYLLVPTLSEVGSWVSLRVSGSSGGGSKVPDRSAHFTSAWRRLEAVEAELASHQRDREQLSGNLTRAHAISAAASRVNGTFANLDVELARIVQEKDAWSASHEQRQELQESPEATAAKRLTELTAARQHELDSRTTGLAGRLESMRSKVEARDGVGKLEAAAGHLDAMRALSGAGLDAEGDKVDKEGEGEGWEEDLQESVRMVVNEALLLQRAIRR